MIRPEDRHIADQLIASIRDSLREGGDGIDDALEAMDSDETELDDLSPSATAMLLAYAKLGRLVMRTATGDHLRMRDEE